MKQTRNSSNLWNQFVNLTSSWLTPKKSNYVIAHDGSLIIGGLVWTPQRSSLLRMSIDAVKQCWCNKANTYLGELALSFGLDTYSLMTPLSIAMSYFGYPENDINLLGRWISGYRTGINYYILTNKYS